MPAEFIQHRQRVETVRYVHSFTYNGTDPGRRGCGFWFDVTADGDFLTPLTPIQQESWDRAHNGEYEDDGLLRLDAGYWDPAVVRCHCGQEVVLHDSMTNECECGQLWNGSGQALRPQEQWEEPWDEDY